MYQDLSISSNIGEGKARNPVRRVNQWFMFLSECCGLYKLQQNNKIFLTKKVIGSEEV